VRIASRRARRLLLLAALAAAATGGAASLLLETSSEASLVVSRPDGARLAVLSLPDASFDHVFVHSFHLTPVRERFRVEAEGQGAAKGTGAAVLRLYELRYQSSGVGMPEDAELGYKLADGVFILKMDRSFASIPLRVSIVEGHGLEIGGRFWPFAEWAAPEKALVLSGQIRKAIRFRR
jgi:hypothetical protein